MGAGVVLIREAILLLPVSGPLVGPAEERCAGLSFPPPCRLLLETT